MSVHIQPQILHRRQHVTHQHIQHSNPSRCNTTRHQHRNTCTLNRRSCWFYNKRDGCKKAQCPFEHNIPVKSSIGELYMNQKQIESNQAYINKQLDQQNERFDTILKRLDDLHRSKTPNIMKQMECIVSQINKQEVRIAKMDKLLSNGARYPGVYSKETNKQLKTMTQKMDKVMRNNKQQMESIEECMLNQSAKLQTITGVLRDVEDAQRMYSTTLCGTKDARAGRMNITDTCTERVDIVRNDVHSREAVPPLINHTTDFQTTNARTIPTNDECKEQVINKESKSDFETVNAMENAEKCAEPTPNVTIGVEAKRMDEIDYNTDDGMRYVASSASSASTNAMDTNHTKDAMPPTEPLSVGLKECNEMEKDTEATPTPTATDINGTEDGRPTLDNEIEKSDKTEASATLFNAHGREEDGPSSTPVSNKASAAITDAQNPMTTENKLKAQELTSIPPTSIPTATSKTNKVENKTRAQQLKVEGNELFKKKQYQKALEAYRAAQQLDPNEPTYVSNESAALYYMEEWEQFISCFDRLLDMKPDKALADKGRKRMNAIYQKKRNTIYRNYDGSDGLYPKEMKYHQQVVNKYKLQYSKATCF